MLEKTKIHIQESVGERKTDIRTYFYVVASLM